ncbi:MAG: hypothetical protein LBM95_08360 [Lactobacillales bacterium]|jgi:hypothetical protein|nr:hypothetical protein [Lactobacillales bacterium]
MNVKGWKTRCDLFRLCTLIVMVMCISFFLFILIGIGLDNVNVLDLFFLGSGIAIDICFSLTSQHYERLWYNSMVDYKILEALESKRG